MGVQMRRQLATSRRRCALGILVGVIVVLAVGASRTGGLSRRRHRCDGTDPVPQLAVRCGQREAVHRDSEVAPFQRRDAHHQGEAHRSRPGTYQVELYDPIVNGVCDPIFGGRLLGKFKVGSGGGGSKVFQVCCYSSGFYVVDPINLDNGLENDSRKVKV
jgi:hypothetical protein